MASRSLGSLTIDLIAKTGGFIAGMGKAERELDTRTKRMAANAKKLGRDIGLSISAIGGVFALGLRTYIKNTIDFQNEQAQLAARLKSTGGIAGQTMQSLDALATQMRKTTAVTGDQISKAQDLLLTFTNVRGAVYQRAIPAILDMSVAMRQDAGQAAILLGKALNDPIKGITALGRSGVQFSEEQKELIKSLSESGEVAKAQSVILKELETQFGGSAAAARNTLGGALTNLRESFDELLEGRDGGLNGTVDKINELSDSLGDPQLKNGIDSLVSGLLSAANAAFEAASKVGDFIASYRNFLAERGFQEGNTIAQLEKLRDRLVEQRGSLFVEVTGSAGKLDREITRIDNRIEEIAKKGKPLFAGIDEEPEGLFVGATPPARPPAIGTGDSDAKKKKAGLTDEQKAAEQLKRAYESLTESMRERIAMFGEETEVAKVTYEIQQGSLKALDEASKQSLLTQAAELDALRERQEIEEEGKRLIEGLLQPFERVNKERERAAELLAAGAIAQEDYNRAIAASHTPAEQMLADLSFQAELLGKSAEEQARLTAAAYLGAEAFTETGRAAIKAAGDFEIYSQAINEQIDLMDGIRDAGKGLFEDLIGGTKSWKEAFTDALDTLVDRINQIVAQKLIDQLFGQQGTTGSGSGGGWISSLLSIFANSGGRANGGYANPYSMVEVNERGFEMASVGNRDYLLTGNKPTRITPNHMLGGSGTNVTNNFAFLEPTSPRTQTQVASRVGFEIRRSQRLGS